MRNSYTFTEIMDQTGRGHGFLKAPLDDYDFVRNALMQQSQYSSELPPQFPEEIRRRRLAATASSLADGLGQDHDSIGFSLDKVVAAANMDLRSKKLEGTNKQRAKNDIKYLLSGVASYTPAHSPRHTYTAHYITTKKREFGVIYRR